MGLLDDHLSQIDPDVRARKLEQEARADKTKAEREENETTWDVALQRATTVLGQDLVRAAKVLKHANVAFHVPKGGVERLAWLPRRGAWVVYSRSYSGERGSGTVPIVALDEGGRLCWVFNHRGHLTASTRSTKNRTGSVAAPTPDEIARQLAVLMTQHGVSP